MSYKIFRKALNLTESDIRFAMHHTNSNRSAAAFVGCDYNTYIKYAKRYIDSATGKTLFDLHLNPGLKGGRKKAHGTKLSKISTLDILEGLHPEFPPDQLKSRVLAEGLIKEECYLCNFSERRITDNTVPLLMVWLDGDFTNHRHENLQVVCYNCFFLNYDDVFEKAESIDKKCRSYYKL